MAITGCSDGNDWAVKGLPRSVGVGYLRSLFSGLRLPVTVPNEE
jgi:hypothetical protein